PRQSTRRGLVFRLHPLSRQQKHLRLGPRHVSHCPEDFAQYYSRLGPERPVFRRARNRKEGALSIRSLSERADFSLWISPQPRADGFEERHRLQILGKYAPALFRLRRYRSLHVEAVRRDAS